MLLRMQVRQGDKISVVGFKGKEATVIIPTTKRATSFKDQIDNITIGGTTPLASGMKKGFEILKKEKFKQEYVPMMLDTHRWYAKCCRG